MPFLDSPLPFLDSSLPFSLLLAGLPTAFFTAFRWPFTASPTACRRSLTSHRLSHCRQGGPHPRDVQPGKRGRLAGPETGLSVDHVEALLSRPPLARRVCYDVPIEYRGHVAVCGLERGGGGGGRRRRERGEGGRESRGRVLSLPHRCCEHQGRLQYHMELAPSRSDNRAAQPQPDGPAQLIVIIRARFVA